MDQSAGQPPRDAAVPRLVGLVWLLLMVNVLGFQPIAGMLIPIPKAFGQLITIAALMGAFALALLLNPRIQARPNGYLTLLSALAVVAVVTSSTLDSGIGGLLRAFRLTVFVAALWLLSRWWSGDLRFVRYHVRVLGAVMLSVLLGIVVAPGVALADRLIGVLWPFPPTEVGQYAAVATGLAIILWATRNLDNASAALVAVPGVAMLLLSHTRTALFGLVVGLAIALLSLVRASARSRRAIAVTTGVGGLVGLMFSSAIMTWLRRGQDEDALESLTGREKVWNALLAEERTLGEQLLGVGLTNKSFDGLPIDSSWLATYHELGLVGVGINVAMLLVLLVTAALRPPSATRACAVFLILYSAVASYTEVGLGDASAYLLHLAVATSLLLSPASASIERSGEIRAGP